MTIGQLKKELDKFPDNMEIKYYNGFVDDWHDISLEECELYKDTLETINANVKYMCNLRKTEFTPKTKVKQDWNLNILPIPQDHRIMYKFKKCLLICGKKRNKSCGDRIGTISY